MGKFTEYKLPLKSMTPGTHTFEFKLGKTFFKDMESEDIHDADLKVNVSVALKNDVYAISMHIDGTITLICDRCLDDLDFPIDTDYAINVEYGDDYNDDSDEVLVIPFSDNTLNIAYMIYDTVELAIPIKHVHAPGKCNKAMSAMLKKHRAGNISEGDSALEEDFIDDMSTAAGQTSDPRWDALKGLTTDNDTQTTIE